MEEDVKLEVEEELQEEPTEEKKSSKLLDWLEGHPKSVFWTRFILWSLFACALPFGFIVWRFNLFQKIAKVQIGGWGIVAIVLVALFAITIIRYIRMAINAKHTLIGQILGGFVKIIIPLLVALAILYSVRDNVNLMIQVLGCVTICEAIAIPLNPLPKWAYEAQKDVREEERKETADYILDGFFKRQDELKKKGRKKPKVKVEE